MNPIRLKITSKVINLILFALLIILYGVFVYSNRQRIFMKFDHSLIDRYLISQDILDTQDQIKNRIFISDEEIYLASGYLYTTGSSPVDYNFQHPPLMKYFFGFSSRLFNLPLLPNLLFSILLIVELVVLSKYLYKSYTIGLLSSILLILDPVFKEVTIYGLLDLGQAVFLLGFIIASLVSREKYLLRGVLLGLALASKFYTPVIFFSLVLYVYIYISRKFDLKKELIVFIVSVFVFYLCYLQAWPYNIFYHQAKIVKFMIDHNRAVALSGGGLFGSWGGVLSMFFNGYVMWTIVFLANFYMLLSTKKNMLHSFMYMIPILYFVIMTFQLPFTRYFILILPIMYLALSRFVILKINSLKLIKNKI